MPDCYPTTKARRPGRARRRSASETAREISATIGPEFFESLVKNVGQSLGADCVYIGEFAGGKAEHVKTLAAHVKGEPRNAPIMSWRGASPLRSQPPIRGLAHAAS
jgi:hypothetical protein